MGKYDLLERSRTMNITRGKKARAQKVVIYGPEGVGKSSLSAQFPDPLFIDTEGSTDNMDVARMDKPSSWMMLNNQITWVKANPTVCKTLVIDTVDWAEQLAIESVCATHSKKGIEEFGYGNGYVYVKEEVGRFLNKLQELVDVGINIVLTAHAQIRTFTQPDEMGAYDRYELKLGKKTSSQTSPLVKEWADMVLFCNYKTTVLVDEKTRKSKAFGGERVMYTTHHPAWDAKNRHNLPFEMKMDFNGLAHIFSQVPSREVTQEVTQPPKQEVVQEDPFKEMAVPSTAPTFEEVTTDIVYPSSLPKELVDLMKIDHVTPEELAQVAYERKHFPVGTPLENIPSDYFLGLIVPNWNLTLETIKKNR